MHKIFFDANAGTIETGYLLWFKDSIEDIQKIGIALREGLHVILYDTGELEMEAY
jgi:hypothetical protein